MHSLVHYHNLYDLRRFSQTCIKHEQKGNNKTVRVQIH